MVLYEPWTVAVVRSHKCFNVQPHAGPDQRLKLPSNHVESHDDWCDEWEKEENDNGCLLQLTPPLQMVKPSGHLGLNVSIEIIE